MDDFIYCGHALTEFGAHAFFGQTTAIGGTVARAQYDAGGDELIDYGEAKMKTFTRTLTIIPAEGVRASDAWQERICRWLRAGGRDPLTLLRAPDTYRLAQFDSEIRFTRKSWPHGALETSVTLSGCAYASAESAVTFSAGTSGSGKLIYETGEARPLRVTIAPGSGSVISAATVTAGGRRVRLSGLAVSSALVIDQAAQQISVTADGTNAFPKVTAWDELRISSGEKVSAALSYSSGGAATVTAAARGRWPA